MRSRRVMALVLSTAMLATAFTGCGGSKSDSGSDSAAAATGSDSSAAADTGSSDSARAEKVVMGLNCDIPGLSPWVSLSTGLSYIRYAMFDYLCTQPVQGGDIVGDMAKDYTVSDDGSTITVDLYDYITDSAGNPIDSSDILFSYNTFIDSGNATEFNGYIDSFETPDDYTFVIHMKDYDTVDAVYSVLCGCPILSEEGYDENTISTAPVTTGPYMVDEYIAGNSLSLVANDNYWQTDESARPANKCQNVTNVVYKIILEDSQLALALETGDVDCVNYVSEDNMDYFLDADGNALDGYMVASQHGVQPMVAGFSFGDASNVKDVNLRQAILYAIDTDTILQTCMGRSGEAVCGVCTEAYNDYQEKWASEDYYDYDVDKAKECLEKSDYVKNGSPTLKILVESGTAKQTAAEMMQTYLKEVGINLDIMACDSALFTSYKTDYDQWDICLDQYGIASGYLASLWGIVFGNTYFQYKDQGCTITGDIDQDLFDLVKTAQQLSTTSDDAIDAVHRYITDNALMYGWWTQKIMLLGQDGIENVVFDNFITPMPWCFTYSSDYQSHVS